MHQIFYRCCDEKSINFPSLMSLTRLRLNLCPEKLHSEGNANRFKLFPTSQRENNMNHPRMAIAIQLDDKRIGVTAEETHYVYKFLTWNSCQPPILIIVQKQIVTSSLVWVFWNLKQPITLMILWWINNLFNINCWYSSSFAQRISINTLLRGHIIYSMPYTNVHYGTVSTWISQLSK